MSGGWIKVHRKILEHSWLSKSRVYSNFEAFMWLLLKANHKAGEWFVHTAIIQVKRGQIVTSQKKLQLQFGWSNTKVRNFLLVAEKAAMIEVETTSKKTCITICNYEAYQDSSTEKELQKNQRSIAKKLMEHTNNNIKNNKKDNNIINNMTILFEKWWNLYDYKIGKPKSMKLFNSLTQDEIDLIFKHTPDYVLTTVKSESSDGTFKPRRKHPSTYLNQKSWNDEIVKDDFKSNHKIGDFQTDGGGINKIGYCEKCGSHDFYTPKEVLYADSRCCNKRVTPVKEVGVVKR